MNEPTSPLRSADLSRLGGHLRQYLLAMETLLGTMQQLEEKAKPGEAELETILQAVLPHLKKAMDSELAFYADAEGRISWLHPRWEVLLNKALPLTPPMRSRLERGIPLVLTEIDDAYPELSSLGLDSFLATYLNAPWGSYLIGVGNSRDDPAYLSEDARLFASVLDILSFGLRYGQVLMTQSDYERYLQARRRGEYSFLSRASEDLAIRLMLSPINAYGGSRFCWSLDDLLADYLDAELCEAKWPRLTRREKDGNSGSLGSTAPQFLNQVLQRIDLTDGEWRPLVHLHDNRRDTAPLELRSFQRTGLAIARICLWTGFTLEGGMVPAEPDNAGTTPTDLPSKMEKATAAQLFHACADLALKRSKPDRSYYPTTIHSVLWRIDWLRTLWQKVHYLAVHGMLEPSRELLVKARETYSDAWKMTIYVVKRYLCNQPADTALTTDSDWLTAWLATNAMLSLRLAAYHSLCPKEDEKACCSAAETNRYLACLSLTVLWALHCMQHWLREHELPPGTEYRGPVKRPPFAEVPELVSPSRTEAQLYVLSEYAYHEIGVHRELNLFERLTRQLVHELSLYSAGEYYRDHLYHVMDVCLLGELLLRSEITNPPVGSKANTLVDLLCELNKSHAVVGTHPEKGDVVLEPRTLLRNWYVASLCHDLGYVVEKAGRLLAPLGRFRGPGLDEFREAAEKGLESGRESISKATRDRLSSSWPPRASEEYLAEAEPTDHGVVSWLHLQEWLDRTKRPSGSLAHALTAVLRHNLHSQKVNMYREPLTLLLMLCDQLQEWGRPRIEPEPLARGVMEALRFSERTAMDEIIRSHELTMQGLRVPRTPENLGPPEAAAAGTTGHPDSVPGIRTEIGPRLEFKIRYVEAQEGGFEPAISWLMLSRDLQCFAEGATGFPLDLVVTLEHTPPQIWHTLPWKPLEMDLLQEFANQYESGAYLLAWIRAARSGKENPNYPGTTRPGYAGIQYTGDPKTGVETVTFKLRELKNPLPRGLPDELWKAFLKWKWRHLGQRYAKLNLGHWFPDLE